MGNIDFDDISDEIIDGYDTAAIFARVEAVRQANDRLIEENQRLRGQLDESRHTIRMLQRRIEDRSYSAAFCRHMIVASVAVAVALTCLLHSIVLAWIM